MDLQCAKIAMPQLTLARYILESSLLEYSMVTVSDSKLAAAALLLSLKMQDLGGWTSTLEYYSGKLGQILVFLTSCQEKFWVALHYLFSSFLSVPRI